jgi:hypothetical protein
MRRRPHFCPSYNTNKSSTSSLTTCPGSTSSHSGFSPSTTGAYTTTRSTQTVSRAPWRRPICKHNVAGTLNGRYPNRAPPKQPTAGWEDRMSQHSGVSHHPLRRPWGFECREVRGATVRSHRAHHKRGVTSPALRKKLRRASPCRRNEFVQQVCERSESCSASKCGGPIRQSLIVNADCQAVSHVIHNHVCSRVQDGIGQPAVDPSATSR